MSNSTKLILSIAFIASVVTFLKISFKGDENTTRCESNDSLSKNTKCFSEYGCYHEIDIHPAYEHAKKTPNIFMVTAIDGECIDDPPIFAVEFFGGGHPKTKMKVGGFFVPEPVGSPLNDYPDDSQEKTTLKDIYFEQPYSAKDGRYYIVDHESPIFHIRDTFIITSVFEPRSQKENFENKLRGRNNKN